MDAKVKAFIDKGKKILNENAELEKEGRAYDKRQKLIELGIFTKGKEILTDEFNEDDPNCEWDDEKGKWRSTEYIVPEVTDEEFAQILESERIQEEDAGSEPSASKKSLGSEAKANKRSAEKFLYFFAVVNAFMSVIAVVLGTVLSLRMGDWIIIVEALTIALIFLTDWAFLKVICNVSNNLHDLNEKVKKQ